MQKQPNIRWRNKDEEKLNKLVRNFNAKINRVIAKNPEMKPFLPDKISKKEVKQEVQTRQDFNKEIKSFERFLQKGNEKLISNPMGLTVTKWEKNEIAMKVGQINRQRTIERKRAENIDALSRGKSTGLKRGEMGNTRTQELKPKKFNFNKIRPGKEWKAYKESVEKQATPSYNVEKADMFKHNYIQALKNVYGNQADKLIEKIHSIDSKTFVDTFFADEQASIDFIYDPIEAQAKLDILTEVWDNVADG